MKLLVIRHGPAGDPDEWEAEGRDDQLRPLTPDGKKQMRRAMAGLATLVRQIDVLATSPLVRAVQSAEIVASEYEADMVTVAALEPDRDPDETVQWLQEAGSDQTVVVVGHEPQLSTLIGYLLTGKRASFVVLKKSGVALLDLADSPSPGHGALESLLTPGALRRLAE
jgi:phosphohistidine phosphatase